MNAMILRYGGFGDSLMLSPLPKILRKVYGFKEVHIGVAPKNVELMRQTKQFTVVSPIQRFGFSPEDFIPTNIGYMKAREYFIKNPEFVLFDYKFSVENNSPQPKQEEAIRQKIEWKSHINSNFTNWFDLALAWSKIPPQSIPSSDKRPILFLTDGQKKKAAELKERYGDYIVVSLNASSPLRNIRQPKLIIKDFLRRTDFRGWVFAAETINNEIHWFGKKGRSDKIRVDWINNITDTLPLLCSAGFGLFSDSGLSHIAEALGLRHTTFYTTVPSMTRSEYYNFETPVDTVCPIGKCFSLQGVCPAIGEKKSKTVGVKFPCIENAYQTFPKVSALVYEGLKNELPQKN